MTSSATDTYLSMFMAMPSLSPLSLLAVFLFTFARIIPIVVIAPFFGQKNVPNPVRVMLSMSLALLFFPSNLLAVPNAISSDLFIGLLIKELLMGFVLGFFVLVPFLVVQMAGTMIDHQRGSSSLQVSDPTTQSQTSPIGVLYNYILIILFFSLNGPFIFFDGLARSYELLPVDRFIPAIFFRANNPFWKESVQLLQAMMTLAVQFAAPALIGILLTDLFLGIANRLAPQVQIVFLGMSLKSWVGLALIAAGWALLWQVMEKECLIWLRHMQRLMEQSLVL